MDLKEPCCLHISSARGEQGRVRVCVWEFGALLLLAVLRGWTMVTRVANRGCSTAEAQRILMPVSNKSAFYSEGY